MIRIKKGREPGKLLWYRQQDGASYEQMDKEVREELIDQLLREQGHLCAYCCLLYTSDAADEEDSVDFGGRRIIKKNRREQLGG